MSVQSIALFAVAFVLGGLALFGFERLATPADAAALCDASASLAWLPDKPGGYRAEAFSNGGRCELAVVTIAVRAPDGSLLLSEAAPAAQVMVFGGVKARGEMQRALSEWLAQRHPFKTSADFPAWPQGADAPQAGEFPFYPEADVDRDTYEQVRAAKEPVFCYVQGMESMACYALSKNDTCAGVGGTTVCVKPTMRKIGLQLFPG